MAERDRPADVYGAGDGPAWRRSVAVAINWLLRQVGTTLATFLSASEAQKLTGWGVYNDTAGAQSLTASTRTQVTINAGTKIETQKPADVASFFTANKITGRTGDAIVVKVQCVFTPSDATASQILFEVDIGGSVGVVEYQTFAIVSGAGIAHQIAWTFVAYTLGTWAANGGTIYATADGPGDLTAKRTVIARIHKAH